jgi:hypothetical protein
MAAAPQPSPQDLLTQNANQRAAVIGMSQKMTQLIRTVSVDPDTDPIITVNPRNVGLILGFIVKVSGGVTNGATNGATRTGFGSANAMKNITFNDLNNVQRINTSGYHLALLNSARQGFGFGGCYAPNLPMSFGQNWAPFSGPATLAADATGTLTHSYYVPLAYSQSDLRGSVYANIVNATMQLQIELTNSADLFVATGADPLGAAYTGNTNGFWTSTVTVEVYQVYLDQIPTIQGQPVLPILDLNTIYDIKLTSLNGMSAAQDFPVPYANFRAFLSTFAIYDNAGVFNSGSDVNYWSLVSANSSQLFKMGPDVAALLARQTFMADPPPGVYYFDHRDKPLDTITYGNLELNLNAITVTNSTARLIMGYESFQQVSQIPVSSSLAGGNG